MKRAPLFSLIVLLLLPHPAFGQQRALFILDSLQQNLDVLYNFNDQSYDSDRGTSSSSMHYFREQYNVDLGYAVYSPYLWKGNLGARLNLSQGLFSADRSPSYNKSDLGVQYSLDGTLLERQPVSLSFFTRAETTHVQRTFSPGYDVDTSAEGVAVSYKNRVLPLTLTYSRNDSETSGLLNNSSQENEVASLKAVNNIGDRSFTEIDGLYSHNVSDVVGHVWYRETDTLYSYSLRNQFYSPEKRHYLDSMLVGREENHRGNNHSLYWRETLNSALGKALTLGVAYTNNSSRVTYDSGLASYSFRSEAQTLDVNLTHRLFQSLVTQLSVLAGISEFASGRESTYSGKASLNYLKVLPEQSSLNLYYSESLGDTDRDLVSREGRAIEEPLTVQMVGQNLLQHPYAQAESVVVVAADRSVRLRPYVRGVDYQIRSQGAYLRLDFSLTGSEVADGAKVLVTYTYLVNPSITFRTSARSVGGTISLFDRRAVVYGSFSHIGQERLSGNVDAVPLDSTTTIIGGISSERNGLFSSLEYDYLDSSFGTNQSVQGLLRLDRDIAGYLLGVRIRDTWSLFGDGVANLRQRTENAFEIGSTLRGSLYNTALFSLGATYINSHSSDYTRNDVQLDVNVRSNYGKIVLLVTGRSAWRFTSGASARDDAVTTQITRYF